MISILTSLKPFRGESVRVQENALRNWCRFGQDVEIIVYGGGEGVSEQAQRVGAKHVPEVRSNPQGVPDFAAIAAHAAAHAKFDLQMYINGDILLPPDFLEQISLLRLPRFLIVGHRIDLAQDAVFNPLAADWMREIWACLAAGKAELHGPSGQDYFMFPRGLWNGLAPLIIGRGGYDNALLAFCLRKRVPIIDATPCIHVIHQWHDYSHVKNETEVFFGRDALENAQRHDIVYSSANMNDANWRLTRRGLLKITFAEDPIRRMESHFRYQLDLKVVSYFFRILTRIFWTVGFRPKKQTLESVLQADVGFARDGNGTCRMVILRARERRWDVRLIINADDLGYSPERNQAIFELMSEGLVTSATVIANAPYAIEACEQSRNFVRCSFGAHLNLTEFRPLRVPTRLDELLDDNGSFNGRIRQVVGLHRNWRPIFEEFCAQIDFLKERGLNLSHLDSHHHIHTIPGVLLAMKAVQRKYGIRKVRITRNIYSLSEPVEASLLFSKFLFNTVLRHWYRTDTTDGFTDLQTFIEMRDWVERKYRTVEIMLHPGAPGAEKDIKLLRSLAQTDPDFRRSLISYSEL